MYLPKDAAQRLSISAAMLRKLTDRGAIGHVRLGTGRQRQRVGYTEDQLAEFIAARTVPPANLEPDGEPIPAWRGLDTTRRRRRRPSPTPIEAADVVDQLLRDAMASGSARAWRPE